MLNHRRANPAPPRRTVILGERGFFARRLADRCARERTDLRVVGSSELDLTVPANARRLADLVQPDDAIVMTSALTPDKGRDYRTLMLNLRMAETVCDALTVGTCKHFLYLSSDAVYDAHKIPLDEDSTREPTDLYALSHLTREMMLASLMERRQIPFGVARLTNIFGPGDTHNSYGPNRFVRSALRDGRITVYGRGEERRSHVFIDDAVELLWLMLTHASAGVLNIATRKAVSFGHVADLVVELLGTPVQIERVDRTVAPIHRPYKPTQVFRFLYNLGRPVGPVVHRTFLNSAVFSAFPGFRFTPLREALRSFIEVERRERDARPAAGTTARAEAA